MLHYWQTFLLILKTPFQDVEMIWGIVPLYFGWFCNELTPSKASFRTAVQTGFTFTWAGAQWLYQYRQSSREISVDALLAVNMVVTLLVLVFGVLAFISGIRKRFPKHFQFLGHTRFAAYFMVAMFPMQSHALRWSWDHLVTILLFAIPVWLLVHVSTIPLRR